jgi:hypothetical protein
MSQPSGSSGGSAVVVVPEGAKKMTPQVTLQGPSKSAKNKHQAGKSQHAQQSRSNSSQSGESSGAGQ